MSYSGFDISEFQKDLNWNTVKDRKVCIIKATEGLSYSNPCLNSQYLKAKSMGMKVGFYHYLRANDPISEVKHFLTTIAPYKSDCLYGIDAEEPTEGIGMSARVRKFADYLISQGKPPVLYTGFYWYRDEITSICKDLPLWVADSCNTRPVIKNIGWQYSTSNGTLDLNIFDDGILLKGVSNVTPITVDVEVLQVQEICNILKITGKNGNVLTQDGIQGTNTTEATARLKSILNNILK